MTTAMKNPKDCDMWTQAFNAKFHNKGQMLTRKEWDQLLGDCDVGLSIERSMHRAVVDLTLGLH